jgi:cytochrome c553
MSAGSMSDGSTPARPPPACLRAAGALALAAALAAPGPVAAQATPAAGRAKAQSCAACHGPLGLATAPDAPNLAGQPADYLAAQLRAYRGGTRQHPVMNVVAKPLGDEDIAALAAWFASLKVEVKEP